MWHYTKYDFRGNRYNKCKLVYAILEDYINTHSECTYSELVNIFPKKLQGSWGVFRKKEDVGRHDKQFFAKPEQLLQIKDCEIAVCGEWGIGNIGKFLEKCKDLGLDVKPIKSE